MAIRRVFEAKADAFFLTQSTKKVQVALVVLQALFAWRIEAEKPLEAPFAVRP